VSELNFESAVNGWVVPFGRYTCPLVPPKSSFSPACRLSFIFRFYALSYFFSLFLPRFLFALVICLGFRDVRSKRIVHLRIPPSLTNPCDESLSRDFEMYSVSENTGDSETKFRFISLCTGPEAFKAHFFQWNIQLEMYIRLLVQCHLCPIWPTVLQFHSFIHQWLYSPLLGPGLFISFVIFFTQTVGLLGRGISPSQGRYLHTGQHKHRLNAYTDMPRVGFEPTIPAFERAKTVQSSDVRPPWLALYSQ
jgi:hypothetical protein